MSDAYLIPKLNFNFISIAVKLSGLGYEVAFFPSDHGVQYLWMGQIARNGHKIKILFELTNRYIPQSATSKLCVTSTSSPLHLLHQYLCHSSLIS